MKMTGENADTSTIRQQIEDLLHSHFKPEFLNRIDETVIFNSLSKEDMLVIVDIQLKKLISRLKDKRISLHIRESAEHFLVESGYNRSFGARPLKRAIQRSLEDPLAMKLLNNDFAEGDHIVVEGSSSGLTFSVQQKS